jgi:hypothetical protein
MLSALLLMLSLSSQAPIVSYTNALIDTYVFLGHDQNAIYRLHNLKPDTFLSVKVDGNGKGDVDCYIIINGHIITKDEGSKDSCDFGIFPRGTDATVWLQQHSDKTVDYHVVVQQ